MKVILQSAWSRSAGGRPIDMYHSPPCQWHQLVRPIVLIGGVHGDEPEGVALAESALQWISSDNAHADKVQSPWVIIPCLNPDGISQGQRVNAKGVDLNRNYPASNWSPEYQEAKYFPGTKPASEPEIQSLVQLIQITRPRLLIHCHSWKPCIVCTGESGQKDAERLSQCSGYPMVSSIGYPTPGSLSHYGWRDQKIPVICIEEEEGASPAESWQRFEPGLADVFQDNSDRLEA